jgi:hypothetical protein
MKFSSEVCNVRLPIALFLLVAFVAPVRAEHMFWNGYEWTVEEHHRDRDRGEWRERSMHECHERHSWEWCRDHMDR